MTGTSCAPTRPSSDLKKRIVESRPSFASTFGRQFRMRCALVMSGLRLRGSSLDASLYTMGADAFSASPSTRVWMYSANCLTVHSCGLPMLTGPLYSEFMSASRPCVWGAQAGGRRYRCMR